MSTRPHLIHRVVLACAVMTAFGLASSSAAAGEVGDLLKSTSGHPAVAPLVPGKTYGASLLAPTPNLTPGIRGWSGAQFESHQGGKVRYENATLYWKDAIHEVDIISGPAMVMSPADTLGRPHSRNFNFDPYDPPTPVKHWTVAGRPALYFDATAPPPGEWTIVGTNPPELRIDRDNSFRMAALTVRGKTVVVVIHGPAADFKKFLPIGLRLLTSLRFPAG
jgi:hypothetical protein